MLFMNEALGGRYRDHDTVIPGHHYPCEYFTLKGQHKLK